MHCFTSITANYLPKARLLARSLKRHNPGAVFHVVFSDRLPAGFDLSREPFDSLVSLDELGIPGLKAWIFKHSIVELCTAVKADAFLKLFAATGADKLIYLDPDIVVFNSLEEIAGLLDRASIILTPHQTVPETASGAIEDNEICSLQHGVYNLGFLAVRRSGEGMRFLRWWRDRLRDYCYADIANGLFTDQRWIDLAPAFFDDLYILRDTSYNVATWNLTNRELSRRQDGLYVDGRPLKFYHFSGYDSGACRNMMQRFAAGNRLFGELYEWYSRAIDNEGQGQLGRLPCVYASFDNGEEITRDHRLLYRTRTDLQRAFPDPFASGDGQASYCRWFQNEIGQVPRASSLEEKCRLLERELRALVNSRSWRLTAPLRRLKRWVPV